MKKQFAQELRQSLYNFLTFEHYNKYYKNFDDYNNIKRNILFEWAGNIEWAIMCDYLNIQIVIFREKTNDLYWGFDTINMSKKLIFILNTNDNHFEPIVFMNKNKIQYIFYYNDHIIKLLKKIKCKN